MSGFEGDGGGRDSLPGVVLFDAMNHQNSGWASVAGEAARKVLGTRELASSAVWLTNLDFEQFQVSGLSRNHRFRRQNYLRSPLSSIADDLGFNGATTSATAPNAAQCASALSDVFSRVIRVSRLLGVPGFPPFQLRQGFNAAFCPPDQTPLSPEILAALRDSTQVYTISERQTRGKPPDKTKTISVVAHRIEHAKQMCRYGVPTGSWRRVPDMTVEAIRTHPRPLLISADILETDQAVGSILNFGGVTPRARMAGSGRPTPDAQPREWMTQPEFNFLSRHARLNIKTVYEAQGFVENPMAKIIGAFSEAQSVSMAFLLAAESIWSAPLVDAQNRQAVTPAAAWISSLDRITCASLAIHLAQRDPSVDIVSFSYGRVTFRTRDRGNQTAAWLADLLEGTHLIPPMIPGQSASPPPSAQPSLAKIYRGLVLSGDRGLIEQCDDHALAEWNRRFPHGMTPVSSSVPAA